MVRKFETLDYDWLTRPTGNPFVDVGGWVIEFLWERFPDNDIDELIRYVAEIYVNQWNAKLHTFFHNSTITQPAFKGQRKIDETMKYYLALIKDELPSREGFCQITGRKTKLFPARAENSILAGSYGFVNFHNFFDQGVMVSKEVLIRMFFVPLGSFQLASKIAVISTNYPEFSKFLIKKNFEQNFLLAASGSESGIYKSKFSNIENALFHYADELLKEMGRLKRQNIAVALTLYHFSSFMQSPSLDVYHLPADVFKFYSYVKSRPELADYWQKFVNAHYKPYKSDKEYKNAQFDSATGKFVIKKDGQSLEVSYDVVVLWSNTILKNLFIEKSILPNIYLWLKSGHYLPFKIAEVYSKIIIKMKPQTVEKVKQLADYIVKVSTEKDEVKRHLNALESARSAADLRRYFLQLIRKNYASGAPEPIITVDEYVNYLFADDLSWSDIRDLLLVAVYEKLHEHNLIVDLEETTTQN
jgi:CRISPR-associated protein Cst1